MITSSSETSPIRWTPKTGRIQQLIDKQISYAPHKTAIYLYPADYETLLASIPESVRHQYVNAMKYRGYSVMRNPNR